MGNRHMASYNPSAPACRRRGYQREKGMGGRFSIIRRCSITQPSSGIGTTLYEIVVAPESWKISMRDTWKKLRPWLPKIVGLILVPIIFYRLLKPIHENWSKLQPHLQEIRWDLLALACLMFAINQYFCRIQLWQGVLHGLGWKMPQAPATRIWVKSELARYIPGAIWQLVGRAYLARPYGLPVAVCSISQTLEFTMNLLAAAIIAVTTLFIAGSQVSDEARHYLLVALALLPLLVVVLVPQVFHPVFNFLLRKLGRPELDRRLSARRMIGLLALACTSQVWLGLAAWIATRSLLQIPADHAYILVGSYCLAWATGVCAGFMAPAGIGFREYILSITLLKVIPPSITQGMDAPTRVAFFAIIALTLRLWATIGELLFAGFGMLWDLRGMRGQIAARAREL